MNTSHEAQAVEAGRGWADRKADALEGTLAQDWPLEWDPSWAGELRFDGQLDRDELADLTDLANREAAEHWLEIVEARRTAEDSRAETEELETRAIHLYEELREHIPEGLAVGRDGARVFLMDIEDAAEFSVHSLGEASRVINDWQERHFGR